MTGTIRRVVLLSFALIAAAALSPATATIAQDNPPPKPIDLPCFTDASVQVLGATPINDGAETLISARIIFAPGGSVSAHTHPGNVIFTVESGSLGFTHLGDGEMSVTRAATAGGEAVVEPLPHGEEVAFNPGDTFIETGMVHSAKNLADGTTTVLASGVITAGQPLTLCAVGGAVPPSVSHR
jgi:hypothetical protein